MRFIKVPALLAVAAAALLALAGSASATTLTGSTEGETTPKIHLVNENGHLKLANPIANIECGLTGEFFAESHGSGVTASYGLTELQWTNCTNSWHVTTAITGAFEFHYLSPGLGTVTWTGMTVTATRLGIVCNYRTEGTDIGTFTDSSKTGGPATVDVEGFLIIHKSSGLCGVGAARWEGNLVTTNLVYLDP